MSEPFTGASRDLCRSVRPRSSQDRHNRSSCRDHHRYRHHQDHRCQDRDSSGNKGLDPRHRPRSPVARDSSPRNRELDPPNSTNDKFHIGQCLLFHSRPAIGWTTNIQLLVEVIFHWFVQHYFKIKVFRRRHIVLVLFQISRDLYVLYYPYASNLIYPRSCPLDSRAYPSCPRQLQKKIKEMPCV